MSQYNAVNILDMVDAIGEDAVKNILSDFSCHKNFEIENYVKKNACNGVQREHNKKLNNGLPILHKVPPK